MPHCIIEFSSNLDPVADIDGLMQKLAAHFRTAPEVFPTAGVRIRAIPVDRYLIADGNPDHGFVNVTCRIGAGRALDIRKTFFGAAYQIVKDHLHDLSQTRGIGLTFYVDQADPDGAWKTNSIRSFM